VLRGVIDRVSEWGGGLLVTDYKKKGTPTQAQIFGERPVSFQMPFYAALLRDAGQPVASAAYYSIEEARYVWVTGGRRPMADGPAMEAALGRLELAVAEMASRLRAGDFTAPRTCASCGERGLCRARFLGEAHGHPLR
jgi:RecB family exonuclease